VSTIRALRPSAPRVTPEADALPRDLDDAYRQYCRYVASVCLRISGRRSELEDLIQEVFAEAASSFKALRDPDAMRGWLATIAVRVTRKRLFRRRLYGLIGIGSSVEYEALPDLGASPYDRLVLGAIYRALDELAPDDRIAFVLHHIEGETLDSVARLAGCSITTAKRRIFRAKTALERRLSGD
jgi:RNA polymerase sigma-70 factor, ECF subfamily